jgi:rubrerythrin
MSVEALIALYVIVLLGSIFLVAAYFSLRERGFGPARTQDRVFRCGKCGFVYTDDPDVDHSRCPQCREMNEAYRF